MIPLPTVFDLEPGIYKIVGLGLLTGNHPPRCADKERKLRDARAFIQLPKKPAWSPAHLDPELSLLPLPSAEWLYLVRTDAIIRFPQCWGSQRCGGPGESLFPCLLQLPKATASLATASNLVSQLSFAPPRRPVLYLLYILLCILPIGPIMIIPVPWSDPGSSSQVNII